MTNGALVCVALLAFCVGAPACSSKGSGSNKAGAAAGGGATVSTTAATTPCDDISGSVACPPDRSDPTGKGLPTAGAVCTLPTCKPCGSATVPGYRDSEGVGRPGWCICVPRSDDSGLHTYSCFDAKEWPRSGS